jgi:hypothetical protein
MLHKYSTQWKSRKTFEVIETQSKEALCQGSWNKEALEISAGAVSKATAREVSSWKLISLAWKTRYELSFPQINGQNVNGPLEKGPFELKCTKPFQHQWEVQINENHYLIHSRLSEQLKISLNGKVVLKEDILGESPAEFSTTVKPEDSRFFEVLAIYVLMTFQHSMEYL